MASSNPTATPTSTAGGLDAAGLLAAGKVMVIAVQLTLLALLVRTLGLQDLAFVKVLVLATAGFVIHAFLPHRFRLPFFCLLSLASIFLVLGAAAGAWLVGLGLALIGICHLPVRMSARIALVLAAGLLLAVLRVQPALREQLPGAASFAGGFSAPWSAAIWPILGSMFMFRLIVYLYDLQHEKGRPAVARTLSYFFMLPNVCFPLFPVVDYKKFHRNYYNEDPGRIYQRGVSWMLRGVVQLILYRLVYYHVAVDPRAVDGLASMLQFSLSALFLYLHVSGQFHVVVGMLLLFGFNLPETQHRYFLASSFTDFWRRINIYWKDFMLKVVYYPVHFRLRKLGATRALVASTLVVFLVTWLLHMVQWFWLRGTLLLEWHDILFWAILGVLVVANALYETRYGRERSLGRRSRTLPALASVWLGTAGTFLTICLLWSMWSSESLSQWLSMWGTTGAAWVGFLVLIPGLFGASWLLGRLARRRGRPAAAAAGAAVAAAGFWRPAIATGTTIVAALLLAQAAPSVLPADMARAFDRIRFGELNQRDEALLELGYYEDLIGVNRHNTELWNMYHNRPPDWGQATPEIKVFTGDFLEHAYMPNAVAMLKGGRVTTNRWGMRDRHYDRVKPANTYRLALLGASHTFGPGVANEETFEAVLEERLNRGRPARAPRYEILNFARRGRMALHQVMILEETALEFDPDALLYVAHCGDGRRVAQGLARLVKREIDIPYADVRRVVERAAVTGDMERSTIESRLLPLADELLSWAYGRLVDSCRERGIVPIWVLLPLTQQRLQEADIAGDIAAAEAAGFEVVSLARIYDGQDRTALKIAPWDNHPNRQGHRLIADGLQSALLARQDRVLAPPAASVSR